MKRFLIIIAICVSASPLFAQMHPITDLADFENRLKTSVSALKTIESDFEQIKHLDMFDEDVRSTGKFAYMTENKIYMHYAKPLDYLVVINDGKLKMVSDGKKSIVALNTNKMMSGMQDMITACMVGDLNRMKDGYNIDYQENEKYYQVTITPKSQTVRDYVAKIRLLLSKANMSVSELYMFENEDDYTRYIFSNQRFNQLKDNGIFSVQ
ncbi:MAG: outer membrane lipoprotein carrier protein LolA [Salinivirgaceae bacterium]|nr:outer membrane lipoprotein carrier protein LolA [Salinivirgaceae bacterium]